MNVSIFARNKQQVPKAPVIPPLSAVWQSDIEVLAPSEVAAVAGGPQVKNDPQD